MSPTLNVNLTLFAISCKFLGIIDLQSCKKLSVPSGFSSKVQSSMTTFHHKLLTIEGRVLANGWTHPSSMTIFVPLIHKKCHPKKYHSDIKYHTALTIILVTKSNFLGVVYTMDHEVVPRPCKICDWLSNSPWDHFNLHKGKKYQSDHGVGGSQ